LRGKLREDGIGTPTRLLSSSRTEYVEFLRADGRERDQIVAQTYFSAGTARPRRARYSVKKDEQPGRGTIAGGASRARVFAPEGGRQRFEAEPCSDHILLSPLAAFTRRSGFNVGWPRFGDPKNDAGKRGLSWSARPTWRRFLDVEHHGRRDLHAAARGPESTSRRSRSMEPLAAADRSGPCVHARRRRVDGRLSGRRHPARRQDGRARPFDNPDSGNSLREGHGRRTRTPRSGTQGSTCRSTADGCPRSVPEREHTRSGSPTTSMRAAVVRETTRGLSTDRQRDGGADRRSDPERVMRRSPRTRGAMRGPGAAVRTA